MEYKSFEEQKKAFDNVITHYFVKRIFDNISESDSTLEGITDSVGNIVKQPTGKNEWAFTHFDKLILSLKNSLGDKYLRNLLSNYEWIKDIDPLFIINMNKHVDLSNVRKHMGMIVTKMEDTSYLPPDISHKEEHIEYDENENFCDKISKALTMATLLLYAYRNDKVPTEIDFKKNVCPSVEISFNVRAYKDYDKCKKHCEDQKLMGIDGITPEGIRKMKSIAECLVDGNILQENANRVENQSHNWEKLGKLRR